MKITFNAPVVLIYTLLACAVQILSDSVFPRLNTNYFASTGYFDFGAVADYFRLASHALGHSGWEHLVGNFSFILLIGPILEEKYGSRDMLFMMLVTAVVTGVLNVLLWDTGLMGASGIVFMMILLGSLVNLRARTLPLTFILIVVLYLGSEIYQAVTVKDDIAQFAHIAGGICGMGFGFLLNSNAKK